MPTLALISLVMTIASFALSLIFKIGGKLRLTIPLVYIILVSTIFSEWSGENETLAINILIGLVILSLGSWVVSLIKFISKRKHYKHLEGDMKYQLTKARELGIDVNLLSFDKDNELIYKDTKERVF